MNVRWDRPISAVMIFALCCAGAAGAAPATTPASKPASQPVKWGDSKAGLQAAVAVQGPVRARSPLTIVLHLRNIGQAPVRLGPRKDAFAWLFVSYGRPRLFFTEKFSLDESWPAALGSNEAVRFKRIRLEKTKAYAFQSGLRIVDGYPAPSRKDEALTPRGTLREALSFGKVRVRVFLYVPRRQERPLQLATNTLDLDVGAPDLAGLPPEQRNAYAKELIGRFLKNAWSAQAASHEAIGAGKEIVPELAVAAANRKAPHFAKMWLGTTIARIGDARGVPAMIKYLDDYHAGVRHVVAYHGPIMRSKTLDAAILAKAKADKDGVFAAWAVRGFWVHRGHVPEPLLTLGLRSKEPKARAAAADALAKDAKAGNVLRLAALLKDPHEMVRVSAAQAIAKGNLRSKAVVGALVAALEAPGETARQQFCRTLGVLTGTKIPYDPSADESARQETLAAWKRFWAENQDKYK